MPLGGDAWTLLRGFIPALTSQILSLFFPFLNRRAVYRILGLGATSQAILDRPDVSASPC